MREASLRSAHSSAPQVTSTCFKTFNDGGNSSPVGDKRVTAFAKRPKRTGPENEYWLSAAVLRVHGPDIHTHDDVVDMIGFS